ncbi:uncharacterized protein SCDLUD_000159 [Saccharomycodes ludwigii]|uniref:uncharacterized protein n=1 Tax=Saccharomycodes ludwigii TaxID=36035 RepID=UPI001E86C92B|nr:hypothetical protein SCDLUD_000159 [Saccharomycodes ludwigii]KAH3902579.1 hypothetical protein SCDLUD_000159 [Saccharomycodes ludwigii]
MEQKQSSGFSIDENKDKELLDTTLELSPRITLFVDLYGILPLGNEKTALITNEGVYIANLKNPHVFTNINVLMGIHEKPINAAYVNGLIKLLTDQRKIIVSIKDHTWYSDLESSSNENCISSANSSCSFFAMLPNICFELLYKNRKIKLEFKQNNLDTLGIYNFHFLVDNFKCDVQFDNKLTSNNVIVLDNIGLFIFSSSRILIYDPKTKEFSSKLINLEFSNNNNKFQKPNILNTFIFKELEEGIITFGVLDEIANLYTIKFKIAGKKILNARYESSPPNYNSFNLKYDEIFIINKKKLLIALYSYRDGLFFCNYKTKSFDKIILPFGKTFNKLRPLNSVINTMNTYNKEEAIELICSYASIDDNDSNFGTIKKIQVPTALIKQNSISLNMAMSHCSGFSAPKTSFKQKTFLLQPNYGGGKDLVEAFEMGKSTNRYFFSKACYDHFSDSIYGIDENFKIYSFNTELFYTFFCDVSQFIGGNKIILLKIYFRKDSQALILLVDDSFNLYLIEKSLLRGTFMIPSTFVDVGIHFLASTKKHFKLCGVNNTGFYNYDILVSDKQGKVYSLIHKKSFMLENNVKIKTEVNGTFLLATKGSSDPICFLTSNYDICYYDFNPQSPITSEETSSHYRAELSAKKSLVMHIPNDPSAIPSKWSVTTITTSFNGIYLQVLNIGSKILVVHKLCSKASVKGYTNVANRYSVLEVFVGNQLTDNYTFNKHFELRDVKHFVKNGLNYLIVSGFSNNIEHFATADNLYVFYIDCLCGMISKTASIKNTQENFKIINFKSRFLITYSYESIKVWSVLFDTNFKNKARLLVKDQFNCPNFKIFNDIWYMGYDMLADTFNFQFSDKNFLKWNRSAKEHENNYCLTTTGISKPNFKFINCNLSGYKSCSYKETIMDIYLAPVDSHTFHEEWIKFYSKPMSQPLDLIYSRINEENPNYSVMFIYNRFSILNLDVFSKKVSSLKNIR